MKRGTLIALLAAIMVMACSVISFADGLELVSSYPEDGQTNTSMENLGVKLTFSNPINSAEAVKADESKLRIYDETGAAVPTKVLFSDKNDGLVLVVADIDEGFVAKNNTEYKLVIDADLVDNDGNTLGKEQVISFRTYNQKINNMVSMGMMFVMFGGVMIFSLRQNQNKEEEEKDKDEPKKAFNPYKEAQRTGKTVEEVKAEQAKKEEKLAKKRARKNKNKEDALKQEKKIENCAELLNNVYHVHAPAPVSKEDRSVDALNSMRRAEARAAKAERAAQAAARAKKRK
ncbi:MAG: Ig-like domain-containing protein [Mogibacterium sp.]|nr:Ig-like domain-containing protein [Mogibacterium sp.]